MIKKRIIRVKSKKEQEAQDFIEQNTKALRRRVIPKKKFVNTKTHIVKVSEIPEVSKIQDVPFGPWSISENYKINNDNEVATGPDLAPVVERLKSEYPIVSQTPEYNEVFTKPNPLVSVIITTYNEADNLINVALKSVLNQTYKNLQIIVIADHSTDSTDLEMSKINDSRVIYQNLPNRTIYPGNTTMDVWMVAGTIPHNVGLSLATGDFITYCDHDDSFTLDRIEKLVKYSQENKCDFIHHPFNVEIQSVKNSNIYESSINESQNLMCGYVTLPAVFHHSWFKQIPVDINCWKIGEPGDWNKCKKFIEIGARIFRYPDSLTFLFK